MLKLNPYVAQMKRAETALMKVNAGKKRRLAAKAGKDVYSEKPCGITIAACQELADTMHREKRVFQAGTQRRSVPNFQKAVEWVHTGKLGKLHTMHASVYVPTLDNTWLPGQPLPPREVVDWNLWLGPAAWRPFNHGLPALP